MHGSSVFSSQGFAANFYIHKHQGDNSGYSKETYRNSGKFFAEYNFVAIQKKQKTN